MVYRSRQGLMPSLDVSHESKSLFPGDSWHKGWSVLESTTFPARLKKSLSGGVISNRENLEAEGVMLKVFPSQECTVKKDYSNKGGRFLFVFFTICKFYFVLSFFTDISLT